MTTFVASEAFVASYPKALALYCSDGRFTQSVEELFQRLGRARLDTLTMPGGAGLFNVWLAGFSSSQAMMRAASFLISAHGIEQAILVAHAGCGFYKSQMQGASAEAIRDQQLSDLRLAASVCQERHPALTISLYYAVPEKRITFHPVPLVAAPAGTSTKPG
jgi:carbonic anhydrase